MATIQLAMREPGLTVIDNQSLLSDHCYTGTTKGSREPTLCIFGLES